MGRETQKEKAHLSKQKPKVLNVTNKYTKKKKIY